MHSVRPVAEEVPNLTYGFSCLSSKACVGGAPSLQMMQHSRFCVCSSKGPGASALCHLHHRMIRAVCSACGCSFSLVGLNVTRTCFHANVLGRMPGAPLPQTVQAAACRELLWTMGPGLLTAALAAAAHKKSVFDFILHVAFQLKWEAR